MKGKNVGYRKTAKTVETKKNQKEGRRATLDDEDLGQYKKCLENKNQKKLGL